MIYCNQIIGKEERPWSACNGATRTRLVVVNTTGQELKSPFQARIGYLEKGRHAFIFLNPGKSNRDYLIWLNSDYGFAVYDREGSPIEAIFSATSVGGYGNSESKFGIWVLDKQLYVEEFTYKNRRPSSWYKVTREKGIEAIATYQIPFIAEEIKQVE